VGSPGGSGANTIFGLGKLGLKTGFIGSVGDDPEGKILLNSFQKVQVDISGIKVKPDQRTSIVHGFVDKYGERALYINPGANNSITDNDLDWEYIKNSRFILFTSFVDDLQLGLQKTIVRSIGEDAGNKIIYSPGALYSKRGYDEISELIENCYLCLLNIDELRNLTDMDLDEGAKKLIDNGTKIVAVTLGKDGCFVTDGNIIHQEPALDLEENKVVDTTGAGDAFATGFIYGLLNEMPIKTCSKLGNYIAAMCIQNFGARSGLPRADEIDDIMNKL
jgi:ribokinase